MRRTLILLSLILGACSAQVSDLNDLEVNEDACDPRGKAERGTDLDLQFMSVTPHVNQDMFFAVTVGQERSIEAIMVLSTLDDPDLHLVVPKLLPGGEAELAFWADSMPKGFNAINNEDKPIDHQWTRPVCPNGVMTFTHTTPFQSVVKAVSTGAVFDFQIPEAMQRAALFDHFHMWVSAILQNDDDEDVQTRAFYRWAPFVAPARGIDVPEQRDPPTHFQVGGNALGEQRGAIDTGSIYRIEFVIDVDGDAELSGGDFVCNYREQAPEGNIWTFTPDLAECDAPDGFDPLTFERRAR